MRKQPPSGPQWIHEVRFDGWRAQLHKAGEEVVIFTRKGNDYTKRFPAIRDSVLSLPAASAIIDAEIVASDSGVKPDLKALMENATGPLCAWCFDLLELNGRELRSLPLVERRVHLRHLLARADDDTLRYSEEFPDPLKLLAAVNDADLKGTVSKLGYQPYRSGKNPGWITVKCHRSARRKPRGAAHAIVRSVIASA